MLEPVGLTTAEESAYLGLLRQGSATVDQRAKRTGRPTTRISRAVAGLHRKGMVHRTPPPHGLVVPVPPDKAIEQSIQRQHAELDRVREAAHALAAQTRDRTAGRRTGELIEIVQGQASVQRAFDRVRVSRSQRCGCWSRRRTPRPSRSTAYRWSAGNHLPRRLHHRRARRSGRPGGGRGARPQWRDSAPRAERADKARRRRSHAGCAPSGIDSAVRLLDSSSWRPAAARTGSRRSPAACPRPTGRSTATRRSRESPARTQSARTAPTAPRPTLRRPRLRPRQAPQGGTRQGHPPAPRPPWPTPRLRPGRVPVGRRADNRLVPRHATATHPVGTPR
jgi:hypothetical protein